MKLKIPNRPVHIRQYIKYKFGLASAYTQTSVAERSALSKWASGKRSLAEIGVFQGVNTSVFKSVSAKNANLVAIDPYPRKLFGLLGYGWDRRIAHQEVSKVSGCNVIWCECLGEEAAMLPQIRKYLPVDFLFIDGDHSWEGIEGDWLAWRDKIAVDGIVALHDSISTPGYASERYFNEVIEKDSSFELVEQVDTLSIIKKL